MIFNTIKEFEQLHRTLFTKRPYGLRLQEGSSIEAMKLIQDGARYNVLRVRYGLPPLDGFKRVPRFRPEAFKAYYLVAPDGDVTGPYPKLTNARNALAKREAAAPETITFTRHAGIHSRGRYRVGTGADLLKAAVIDITSITNLYK